MKNNHRDRDCHTWRIEEEQFTLNVDKKNNYHYDDTYQPRRIEEKIQCDGKPSYTILEQGNLERSLLMMKNPTQPN